MIKASIAIQKDFKEARIYCPSCGGIEFPDDEGRCPDCGRPFMTNAWELEKGTAGAEGLADEALEAEFTQNSHKRRTK